MTARILVIEDSPTLLALYHDLFEDEGYEVILQSTPQFDPVTIAEIAPDLIVLDLIFDGDLVGWDVVQAFKQHHETASTPIVVCSGATKYVDVLGSAFNVMGVHVLTKPFDLETLLEVVERLLAQYGPVSSTSLPSEHE